MHRQPSLVPTHLLEKTRFYTHSSKATGDVAGQHLDRIPQRRQAQVCLIERCRAIHEAIDRQARQEGAGASGADAAAVSAEQGRLDNGRIRRVLFEVVGPKVEEGKEDEGEDEEGRYV